MGPDDLEPRAPSSTPPLDALPADRRGLALRHRRLVGAFAVVLVAGLVVLRCAVFGGGDDHVAAGHRAMARALTGDVAAWDEAEQAFAQGASLTEPYPLFALEAARRLREHRWDDAAPDVRVVFEHLARGRWSDAVAAASGLSTAGAEPMSRLVRALEAEARRLAGEGALRR